MECSNCGAANDASHKFCRDCGSPLSALCPSCGHGNPPDHKFCSECGTVLGDTPAVAAEPATPAAEPGERRFVSVLFADLVGFTTFSESRDPEAVRAMLTRYFDRARETIERFGGEVDKFIGDAVTAFWGAKHAKEDDAERAVRAALELVDSVEALGDELEIPDLAVRVGVLSGEASVGVGGNEKGLVVGDIVNTASRLQSAAAPGTVFVGDSTKQLTERGIRYREVGEQDLKGKSVPVVAWRAIDLLGERGGKGHWGGLEAPFVGRDDELRLLKDQVHATTRDGHARLVSIVGEPGIGKSRLGWELQKYTDGLDEQLRWHQGRSPAYGDGVTFWALGEMVRRRARIAETDEPHKARTKLRTAVAEYVPDPEEQRWIEPRLAGLLGLDEMPPGDRSELFAALRTFFQRVSETGTTVLLFEDLHWADAALLDFIEELIDRSPRHPILVVTLARPDLTESRPQWGGRRNGIAVHLGPLTDAQMTELVTGLAPGIPDAAAGLVVKQAAGIPLYAVEYIRMLLASGQLVQDGSAFALVESLDSLDVPDSLHSVIAARLDRFPENDRDLIQQASVLGQSFTLEGLVALTGFSEAELAGRLTDLSRQEIFRFEDDPDAPERGQYQFVQGVIKEVAYGRLAKTERRERHLRVAAYFQAQDDPEMAAIIASHYANAYEAEPDDELAATALRSLTAAAERAAELKAHEQVLALCRQAIEFAEDDARRGPIELMAAQASYGMDREQEAVGHAEAALALLDEAGLDEAATGAATTLATILLNYRRIDLALELLRPRYEAVGETSGGAALAAAYARAVMMSGNDDEAQQAIDAADVALVVAESGRDDALLADALITKGSAFGFVGRHREGEILVRGGLDIADRADLTQQRSRAINNLAASLTSEDERQVFELSRRGLDAAIRSGDAKEIHDWALSYAWFAAFDGDYDEATRVVKEFDVWVDAAFGLGSPHLYVAWATGQAPSTDELRASVPDISEADRVQTATRADVIAAILFTERRYEDAYSAALGIEFYPWIDAPQTALAAALLLGDRDRFEQASTYAAEFPFPGAKSDRFEWLVAAGRALFDGDTDEAVATFSTVIEQLERVGLARSLNWHRFVFAAAVGQDVPEAGEAARDAHQWILDTGSYGYLEAWKDGLPPQAVEAVG